MNHDFFWKFFFTKRTAIMIGKVTWGVKKLYLASRRRYVVLKRRGAEFSTRIPSGVKTNFKWINFTFYLFQKKNSQHNNKKRYPYLENICNVNFKIALSSWEQYSQGWKPYFQVWKTFSHVGNSIPEVWNSIPKTVSSIP